MFLSPQVAVVGCSHGELDAIYDSIAYMREKENTAVDLLLCCGDFQSIRNAQELLCMSCPPKYRSMNTFWKYYAGIKRAPVLTVFIGGNHEGSNYLLEL